MKKMHLLAGVAVATLLAGCFGGEKTEQSGETLATVNGAAVKESRIADQLAQIPQNILQGRETEIRRQLLDRVIDQELVAQEAERLSIEKDAEYQKRLNLMTLQLKADAVMARKISESVTQDALQAAYNARRDQLAFPAVKAKHILVPTDYIRVLAEEPQDMVWSSNATLNEAEKGWHIEVTSTMFADICDVTGGEFLPMGVNTSFNDAGDSLTTMYGPICFADMPKKTPYLQNLVKAMGGDPGGEFTTLMTVGGMDENGRWFVDYSLLEVNGLLDTPMDIGMGMTVQLADYLACKSDYPFVNENGEMVMQNGQVVMVVEKRAACQPNSPANADNNAGNRPPPPYYAFIQS